MKSSALPVLLLLGLALFACPEGDDDDDTQDAGVVDASDADAAADAGDFDAAPFDAAGLPSILTTLEPALYDLTTGVALFEPDVEAEFGDSPQGDLLALGSTPVARLDEVMGANLDELQRRGQDWIYVFAVEGDGTLWFNSPRLLGLREAGFDYDAQYQDSDPNQDLVVDIASAKKRYALAADLVGRVVEQAHSRSLQVVVNIETLAHIINSAAGSGIGASGGMRLTDNLPPPSIADVEAVLAELIALGVDAVAAEAFDESTEAAIAAALAAANVPYWRAGADIGDVWMAYHYSLYPAVREEAQTFQYLYTSDSLTSTSNGSIHARARATGTPTLAVLGAYNPLPCDLSLTGADLYNDSRPGDLEAIDNEKPLLADGTPVDNCAVGFWRNQALFTVLGQGVQRLLLVGDLQPSFDALLDASTVQELRRRLADHPPVAESKPVAQIVMDLPDFDPVDDAINAADWAEMVSLSIVPLVSDGLEAAGFETQLVYDHASTSGVDLVYIITAGGNEETAAGDLGAGPPTWSSAQDLPADLLALVDGSGFSGPVFVHPIWGLPELGAWGDVRAQFGLPSRFAYANTGLSSDATYHTSLLTSVLVDDAGEAVVEPGELYIVPARGSVGGVSMRLEPWYDIFGVGHFANVVASAEVDPARVRFSGPLAIPSHDGAGGNITTTERDNPYLLHDGAGHYLWLINQLHHEAFVYLLSTAAAESMGRTPVLGLPATVHLNSGRRSLALAYEGTSLELHLPYTAGDAMRTRVYDANGLLLRDEQSTYADPLTLTLDKRSLLVVEPAGF